jgi:transposase
VIDNASVHWGDTEADGMRNQLEYLCSLKGAVVLYIPPFCPNSNAIESLFKHMNDDIRAHRTRAEENPAQAIIDGLCSCPAAKCLKFVQAAQREVATYIV